LPLGEAESSTDFLKSFLTNVSNSLTRLPFSHHSEGGECVVEDTEFHALLSKRILWTFCRWQEKYSLEPSNALSRIAPMASVTAFIILTLSVLVQKKYSSLWWMGIIMLYL
jgi:hypothetical protein